MALIDKASLLMVPSTYEAGKLYNVLPSGNRAPDNKGGAGYDQTRADFDFDRGSNTAATRIGSDGLIKKYRENELVQSNQFDTTWANTSSTETGGQADKDGGTDAWLLDKSNFNGRIYQTISFSDVGTFSVYAKAGTLNWMRLRDNNGVGAYFDLSGSGAVGSMSSAIDAKIESVGGGWFRCSVSANWGASDFRIYPADADGDTSGTSGNIYIQNAQLESGLVSTDYLESTSVTGKAGVLVDLPRINYDANGENGALLLEPSRANLVAFSEYLNGGIWVKSGCSVTDNDATSPEGLTNASKVEGGGGSNQIRLYDNLTFPSAGDYTLSVFAKAGNNDFLRLNFGGVTGAKSAFFDLVNGTTEETWATIEPVGTDGWHRCSITADLTGPDLTGNYNFYVAYSYTTAAFPSNSDANGQYVYLYGAQLEANATYPSSYIPNHSGTGGVTRAADSCSVTGASDVIGQSEGTLFVEFDAIDVSDSRITLSDGTSTNRLIFRIHNNGVVQWEGVQSGADQWNIESSSGTIVSGSTYKIAAAYGTNNVALYVNGTQIGIDNAAVVTSALNAIKFANASTGTFYHWNHYTKQVLLFKTRLSNEELAALTTI